MKIDLSLIDRTQFHVDELVWNGEMVYLIQPQQMGCAWSQENKIFRSSVWNSDGDLISASFPKFVNWGEKPEVFPVPNSLKNATIMEKLDGSTLIVSKYKGNFMIRTRGTIDAARMEKNGFEIEYFKTEVLPILVEMDIQINSTFQSKNDDTWVFSYIFEWTSPLNTIVINYGDVPKFYLIGIIDNNNYSLCAQAFLDDIAKSVNLQRPATYTFTDVIDLLENIQLWEGKEGVCVYHHGDQEIHKVKSAWYLMLHRMKSELGSLDKVIDVWGAQNYPDYNTFYNYIGDTFDYELAETCRGHISRIADGYKEVLKIVAYMKEFVEPLKRVPRKDAALKIISSYGNTNRSSFCFQLLDGKDLMVDREAIKKLLFQVLK
jgi:hypothetical protein